MNNFINIPRKVWLNCFGGQPLSSEETKEGVHQETDDLPKLTLYDRIYHLVRLKYTRVGLKKIQP